LRQYSQLHQLSQYIQLIPWDQLIQCCHLRRCIQLILWDQLHQLPPWRQLRLCILLNQWGQWRQLRPSFQYILLLLCCRYLLRQQDQLVLWGPLRLLLQWIPNQLHLLRLWHQQAQLLL
jgi:hypothetical protein